MDDNPECHLATLADKWSALYLQPWQSQSLIITEPILEPGDSKPISFSFYLLMHAVLSRSFVNRVGQVVVVVVWFDCRLTWSCFSRNPCSFSCRLYDCFFFFFFFSQNFSSVFFSS